MKITFTPQSVYDTPAALKDAAYRRWLGDVRHSALRLAGVDPLPTVALGPRLRRYYLAGLSAYAACGRLNRGA